MPQKKVTKIKQEENVLMILPSDNEIMSAYIQKNKVRLTETVLNVIEHAVNKKLPFVEVFGFNDSDFIIAISEKDFLPNVDHIYKFYLESENYELCKRVVKLQTLLKNLNEKEIETTEKFK